MFGAASVAPATDSAQIDIGAADTTAAQFSEFAIITQDRTFYFRCHSEKDAQAWVASLRKVKSDVSGSLGRTDGASSLLF